MERFFIYIFTILSVVCCPCICQGEEYSPQVIKIYDESEVQELIDAGVDILRRRGDILLCLVPSDGNGEVTIPNSSRKSPRYAKDRLLSGRRRGFNVPALDMSVKHFDAIDILEGNGFDQPYTGKGVVVGICDIGFDPLHPTFLDANGHSRVKRLTQYVEREGIRIELEGDDAYREWRTDNADNYHATHVCGILAGNGAGSPYVGIARDADIVVSTSTLTDVGLLAGVEDIIDYAKEVGKPAVINLSMGNYLGAHDGSGLFSQYLDLCAEDAIIVLSAGNEGNRTNTLYHQFTETMPEVSFRLGDSTKWNQIEMYGATDIWSGSSHPLAIRINIYDEETKSVVYSYPELRLCDYDSCTFTWNSEDPDFRGNPFTGYLKVYGGIDPENGRYQALLTYDFQSSAVSDKGWSKYVVKVDVIGTPGNDVDIFADGTYTRLMGVAGNPAPSSAMSISDLSCGFNVISVGMYGNRSSWTATESDGEEKKIDMNTGYEAGQTVIYSSYGTLRDGRSLPSTTAPGAPLVSAFNRHYHDAHPEEPCCISNGIPWISEPGTSMASPYVAGFIATWIEAIPNLTSRDVMDVIMSTNRHDIDSPDNPRNINGWFDPRSALLDLLNENGVWKIDDYIGILQPDDIIDVFSLSGSHLYCGKYADMPFLNNGVYMLKSKFGVSKILK
ncbi:MAG: S8 family serine peptidase [Muribaculum sp.]|nr:S8 family serine peptidase [Muribaculum sp.]